MADAFGRSYSTRQTAEGTTIYDLEAEAGETSGQEAIYMQYPQNGIFGPPDGVNYTATHTLDFPAPTIKLDSIKKMFFDFSVMAHVHFYATNYSAQGWYRATGEIIKPSYNIPIVDVTAKGNHSASNNFPNPYGSDYEYNGSWHWELDSATNDPVINDFLESNFDNHLNGKSVDLSTYIIGQYNVQTFTSATCTINPDGSVTAVLRQPQAGYDGQILATNGSVIYYF